MNLFTTYLFVIVFISVTIWCKVSSPEPVKPVVVDETLIWENGIASVSVYRCPLITYTPQGNLLVITEGRKSGGDASPKFIAVRRSLDRGQNFGPTAFIYNDGFVTDGDNLGAVLVDDITKTIFLFFGLCNHHVKCNISSVAYIKSVDDGITWSKQVNISEQIGMIDFAPGPGRGIQKKYAPHKGRLIVCGHGGMVDAPGVKCLISDDHGDSWRVGASLPAIPFSRTQIKGGDFDPNECQPEELPDGSIMVNIRNQLRYHCSCRIVAMSYDGLDSLPLENVTFDETLIDPAVSASILFHNGVLFFSNPANKTHRAGMTLRWSYDNGKTWSGSLPIWYGPSGYSVMTAMPSYINSLEEQKYLYLVFEKGASSPTETVAFVKISLTGTLYDGVK